ncbi:mitogen-activated protein kinase 19-like [Impatiens glandulifera]|uniref:mitogen-activated protein kinase 19-like n=1 Tax=Impatiens glandulifera TaxID=253017 RepID=UPI001FB1290F|nr:mitogen-activated protein kinase 19-like [Impatiens glandulifera]
MDFFTEYGEANRYKILEVVGKGSYGVVCAAIDTQTGEKVAIKKITNIFEHISDATRILREIKLLRLLLHPDIVDIKCIMLPPSRREFKDIYVIFELMESDLHQVIKANDDLTPDHHRFFLYQMLRALKYMHTANVYHRDLKPKNILANANCKLKICDFGLARVAFNDTPATIFWTDYVATRWYRAPELCGSFLSRYTPAIDIWSIGCIFAEVLTGKPLFPGKSVVHQLDLITNLLGTPSSDTITGVRNDKARKYLTSMRKKNPVGFTEKFPNADPLALNLLKRLLAFDPKDRPTAEEALADPYFKGLAKIEREPSCQPISKLEFEFERRRVTKEDIRELIYREILEHHPQMLKDHMEGIDGPNFMYPSAVGQFRRQFNYLQENSGQSGPVIPPERKHASLPRSTINSSVIPPKSIANFSVPCNRQGMEEACNIARVTDTISGNVVRPLRPPPRLPTDKPGLMRAIGPVLPFESYRNTNDASGSRLVTVHNSVAPSPMTISISPGTNKEKEEISTKAQANGKPASEMPVEVKRSQLEDQISLNARVGLKQKSPFSATAAAHREVGTVHLG